MRAPCFPAFQLRTACCLKVSCTLHLMGYRHSAPGPGLGPARVCGTRRVLLAASILCILGAWICCQIGLSVETDILAYIMDPGPESSRLLLEYVCQIAGKDDDGHTTCSRGLLNGSLLQGLRSSRLTCESMHRCNIRNGSLTSICFSTSLNHPVWIFMRTCPCYWRL